MPYIEKRIRSGRLLEIERYFASRNGRPIPRGENRAATPQDMERVNQRNAEKRLMRLINANFCRESGDLFVTFTHAEPLTEEMAMREERNLLARLTRWRARRGMEPLKYIAVTEKQGRWHHHLIINGGLTQEELDALWGGRGRWTMSTLDNTYTYEDLAKYLTKAHKERKGEPDADEAKQPRRKFRKRWHASRNLAKPVVTKKIVKRPPAAKEPKPPKGYRLLNNWFVGCDLFGNLYCYAAFVHDGAHGAGEGEKRCRTLKTRQNAYARTT